VEYVLVYHSTSQSEQYRPMMPVNRTLISYKKVRWCPKF